MWGVGIADLVIFLAVLRRQVRLLEAEGPATAAYHRVSLLGRGLGGGGQPRRDLHPVPDGVQARNLIERETEGASARVAEHFEQLG
jgi:hypothetical protein